MTMQEWILYALADTDRALLNLAHAEKITPDHPNRVQLERAKRALLDAKSALRWVQP